MAFAGLGLAAYLLVWRGDGDDAATTSTSGLPVAVTGTRSSTLPPSTAPTTVTSAPASTTTTSKSGSVGYSTPEAAVQAEIPAGWVITLAADSGTQKEYWSGPPQSEWVTAYQVEQGAGGSWSVTNTWALGASDLEGTPQDQAVWLVEEFLYAIMDNEADYAHTLTVEPFSLDPASAQFSNGDFLSFVIASADEASDGTFWIGVEETWSWGTDRWRYHVIPTPAGLRIDDLRPL